MVRTQDKLKWLGVGFILTANLVGCSKKTVQNRPLSWRYHRQSFLLTANNMCRIYGNGAALTDSASGMAGNLVRLDAPSRDGLDLNAAEDLIYGGSSGALKLFIGYRCTKTL